MLYSDSYKVEHLKVEIKNRDEDYLKTQIEEDDDLNNIYKNSINGKVLSLYGFFVEVAFLAKNSSNIPLHGIAFCEFDSFALYNKISGSPIVKQIDVGGKIYYSKDMLLNFDEKKAGLVEINTIGFFDKLEYLINRHNIDIVYN